MSHFDDIEPVFYGNNGGGGGPIALFITVVVMVIAGIWAYNADGDSKSLCEQHGEVYIDSRIGYTLCERKDGTVIKR